MKVDENKIETSERISTLSELDAVRENDLFKPCVYHPNDFMRYV
jgi:hypothetical protein